MQKRTSATARILAALALIAGFVLVVAVFSAVLGGDDGDDGGNSKGHGNQVTRPQKQASPKKVPATYEVEEGDTLTSIAQSTGVSVSRIQQLNPGVDPQILEPGEELKLR